jgi:energy-coupling factor transport system permease protein
MQHGTLYIEGRDGLYQFHPLSKLALVSFFLVAAATSPNLFYLLAVFLLLLLPLAAISGLLRPFLKTSLVIIIPFLISLAIIQGFFTAGHTVLLQLGRFTFTLEGLLAGGTAAARILVALGGALLLMLCTRPDYLMLALTQRGLPNSLAYIVLTSIQIFPRFQDRARVIQEAQQARGLELQVNLVKRLQLLAPLIGPLVLGSIVDVEERAMALEARAFSRPGPRTSLLTLHDSFTQRVLRTLLLLAMLALVAWRFALLFSK